LDSLGNKIESGKLSFVELAKYAETHGEPKLQSGRQELLKTL
jgi:xylose isomerase